MQLGIIGLPQAGKTTLFNALTRGNQPTTMSAGRFDVHMAVVDVPDARLAQISAMFKPHKTIYAKVTYADIAGLEGSAGKAAQVQKGLSGALLNQLSQMDGFIHVVRCFEDPNVLHQTGSVDPRRDLQAMDAELLLNDLIMVERKLERLDEEHRKIGGREKERIGHELELFKRLHTILSEEKPLRTLDFSPEEEKTLSSFGFLTLKPVLVVLNLGEGQEAPQTTYPHRRSAVVSLQGNGIEELSLSRVIRLSYDLMGLQSFFTIGDDEVHAWTVRRGTTAYDAAGVVHTDLQKGFIRAEVINWQELVKLGSLAEARSQGKLRLEGKQYIVQDGEVVRIRFNV
jgi:ribosome-binding ATPase YchF (GTP1/OBG family)